MRKIVRKDVREKQRRINQIIIGIVLILLMVFSSLGFAFSNNLGSDGSGEDISSESLGTYEHNGITFTDTNGLWFFTYAGIEYAMLYGPWELMTIPIVNGLTIDSYRGKPLYIIGGNGDGAQEITLNLQNQVSRIQEACLEDDLCDGDFPIKDCLYDNIVIIKASEEGEIGTVQQDANCVYITSEHFEQVQYADAFLYSLLGI
jgi:hypothetical protein